MGFTSVNLLDTAYEHLREAALAGPAGAGTVLIFVAPDVDSVCGLKILLIRCVVMINAGGMIDVDEFLSLGAAEGAATDGAASSPLSRATVYIVDTHRPLNLRNVFGSSRIVVLDDGSIEGKMREVQHAFESLEFDGSDSSSSESGDESEAEDGDGVGVDGAEPSSKLVRRGSSHDADDGDAGEDDDDNDSTSSEDARGGQDQDDDEENNEDDGDNDQDEARDPEDDRDEAEADGKQVDKENARSNAASRKPAKPSGAGESADTTGEASARTTTVRKRKPRPSRTTSVAKRQRRRELRRQRREHQRVIAEYYSGGTFHGTSAAVLLHKMATQLGRDNSDHLWCAIVGLTDQFIHNRVAIVRYLDLVHEFKEQVEVVSLREGRGAAGGDRAAGALVDGGTGGGDRNGTLGGLLGDAADELLYDVDDLFGERPRRNPASAAQISVEDLAPISSVGGRSADDRSIHYHEDLKLMLLKHWNIYESMFHSEYVATKLGIWRAKGREYLTQLLVKMGLPQKESRQFYREVSLAYKQSFKPKLLEYAPQYRMPDLVFPSFYRNHGFTMPLSASDVVYALSALLDGGATWVETHGTSAYEAVLGVSAPTVVHPRGAILSFRGDGAGASGFGVGGGVGGGPGGGDGDDDGGDRGLVGAGVGTRTSAGSVAMRVMQDVHYTTQRNEQEEWVRNFYTALDAMDNIHLVHHGILLAIHFQRVMVSTGMMILDKKEINTLQKFRMVTLKNIQTGLQSSGNGGGTGGGSGSGSVLGHSVAILHRLSGFLMDAFAAHRDKNSKLPLVLVAGLDKDPEHCLVMGRADTQQVADVRKNPFGLAFQAAAESAEAQVTYDSFEASVVHVRREDLSVFLEELRALL
nr:hypothetical protein HK105_000861 [Polyrhizophydium stewartii]